MFILEPDVDIEKAMLGFGKVSVMVVSHPGHFEVEPVNWTCSCNIEVVCL